MPLGVGGGQVDHVVEQVLIGWCRRQLEPRQRVGVLALRLIRQIALDVVNECGVTVGAGHLAQRGEKKLERGQALLAVHHLHHGGEGEFRAAIDGARISTPM